MLCKSAKPEKKSLPICSRREHAGCISKQDCSFIYLTNATPARYNQNLTSIKNNHSKQGGTDFLFLQNITSHYSTWNNFTYAGQPQYVLQPPKLS